LVSWGVKLISHPTHASSWREVALRAQVGALSGEGVLAAVAGVYVALILLGVISSFRRRRIRPGKAMWPGKRLPRMKRLFAARATPRERMALLITACGKRIGQQLMTELGRGVTALEGEGMYTGEQRDVLICAVTDVQVQHLEAIVQREDPRAFVVVSSTEEVRGWGFDAFAAPS